MGWGAQERVFWIVPDIVGICCCKTCTVYLPLTKLVGLGFDRIRSVLYLSRSSSLRDRFFSAVCRFWSVPTYHFLLEQLTELWLCSSRIGIMLPLVGRIWLPTVCSLYVQCAWVRQRRYYSCCILLMCGMPCVRRIYYICR